MLLALTGPKNSGKTTAAKCLAQHHGFAHLRFAGAIKGMVLNLLLRIGYDRQEAIEFVDGDRKEEVIPELGVTGRHLMQTLGSEWGRDHVRPDLWAVVTLEEAQRVMEDEGRSVVIDDCRFPNEAEATWERGGVVVRIVRPSAGSADSHRSEQRHTGIDADYTIRNEGSIEDFRSRVSVLPNQLSSLDSPAHEQPQ